MLQTLSAQFVQGDFPIMQTVSALIENPADFRTNRKKPTGKIHRE